MTKKAKSAGKADGNYTGMANVALGAMIVEVIVMGALRVALNGAEVEKREANKAIAEGLALPDYIFTFIDSVKESLNLASEQGVLPSEWSEGLPEYASVVSAHYLSGEAIESEWPGYYKPMNTTIETMAGEADKKRTALAKEFERQLGEFIVKEAAKPSPVGLRLN